MPSPPRYAADALTRKSSHRTAVPQTQPRPSLPRRSSPNAVIITGLAFIFRRKGQMAGRRAILRKPAVTRSRRENSSTSTASKSDASNAGRIVRDLTNHPGVEEAEPIPLRYSELTCQALEISTCKQGGTLQTILLSTHVANTALCIRHHLLSRIDDSLSIPKFK